MKKTFLACILAIVSACISTISAQENEGVAFLEGKTFAEAVEVAKESGKKIFLDCYTSWCGPCKMVARDIFPKKVAGDYFNQEFINIKIDMEKGEGPELAKRLGVKAYPTFVMFDSQGKEIGRLVGSRASAADFVEAVKTAIGESGLVAMSAKYDAGERSQEFLYNYLTVLSNAYDNEKCKIVAEELLNGKTQELLEDEALYNVFLKHNESPLSPTFQYVLQHKDEFKNKYPKTPLDRVMAFAWMSYPRTLIKKDADGTATFDRKAMKAYVKEMKKWGVENREEIVLLSDINVAEATQNWGEYAKLCSKYIKKYGEKDMYIYNWSLRIQQNCQDRKVKDTAISWMQQRIDNIKKEEAKQEPLKEGEVRPVSMNRYTKSFEELILKLK